MNLLELLTNYTYAQALYGTVIIGTVAGAIGPLVYLRRTSLLADAVAHSSLPGLLLVFLAASMLGFDGRISYVLIAGSILTGALAVALIHWLPRQTKIKKDAAMAATLTTFFSVGMLLMQYISRQPLPGKAGIQDYLLGNASTLTRGDVRSALVTGGIALLLLIAIHHAHAVVVCDPAQARVAGVRIRLVEAVAFLALVAVTVIGVKVVGVVLMVAVVVAPAAAARQFTHRLLPFIAVSATLGALAAVIGCYISIAFGPLPTGPVIVLVQAAIVATSLIRKALS